jgi:hypothetical protein
MNEIERQELEAEEAARQDYLREAYGSEADLCADADAGQAAYEHAVWLNGLTPEARADFEAAMAARKAEQEAAYKAAQNPESFDVF